MSQGQTIRAYDYVNHPFEKVSAALTANPLEIFQAATKNAADRAHTLASELSVDLGGLKIAADIAISVKATAHRPDSGKGGPSTIVHLEWEAANRPQLFPFMRAELSAYPLTGKETQLDFSGTYEPPLGAVGAALDAAVGHRIAESSVHRFVAAVAEHLRTSLK